MTTRIFTPHERRARLACALCAGTLLAVGLTAHAQQRCDAMRIRVLEARLARLRSADADAAAAGLRRENAELTLRLRAYERAFEGLPRGGGAPSREAALPSRDMDPPTRDEQ